eukprot:scaffold351_cov371-Prasinococcus_capsulatus_cf.AAC.16
MGYEPSTRKSIAISCWSQRPRSNSQARVWAGRRSRQLLARTDKWRMAFKAFRSLSEAAKSR